MTDDSTSSSHTVDVVCPECGHAAPTTVTVRLDDAKLDEVINRHLAEAMDAMAGALDNTRE